jgi:hypothetical protein
VWSDESTHSIRPHQQHREFSIQPAGWFINCLTAPHILNYRQRLLCFPLNTLGRTNGKQAFTTFHHITVVNCANGFPKTILDAGLVTGAKLYFSSLHAHLTSILYIFSVGYFRINHMPVQSILARKPVVKIEQIAQGMKNKPGIF